MTSHELSSSSPQEQLAAAKAAFRSTVLENDTLFSVVQAQLKESGETGTSLPDFGLEPTINRNEDNTSVVGLRINHSAIVSSDGLSLYTGVYGYIPLGLLDRATGDTKLTPEFKAALTAAGKETSDAQGVLQAWQTGLQVMGSQYSEPLVIDPMTGTFELETELMARNYVVDEQ